MKHDLSGPAFLERFPRCEPRQIFLISTTNYSFDTRQDRGAMMRRCDDTNCVIKRCDRSTERADSQRGSRTVRIRVLCMLRLRIRHDMHLELSRQIKYARYEYSYRTVVAAGAAVISSLQQARACCTRRPRAAPQKSGCAKILGAST